MHKIWFEVSFEIDKQQKNSIFDILNWTNGSRTAKSILLRISDEAHLQNDQLIHREDLLS